MVASPPMWRFPPRAAMPRAGLAVASGLLLLGVVFAGDSFWVAAAAVLVAGAALVAGLLGVLPLPPGPTSRSGHWAWAFVASLVGLAVWSGASIGWSIGADRSWDELNRGLVYASFALLGVMLAASGGSRGCRLAAALVTLAFGAALVWALAGKVDPSLFPDGGRAARLRDPIGYWNALALAADAVLVLSLWLATSRTLVRPARLGGAILGYAAVVAVLLTVSRAGLLAALLGVALWLFLSERRLQRAIVTLAIVLPAFGVAGWAFTQEGLVEDGAAYAVRVADGRWFGLVFLLGAQLVALAVSAVERYRPDERTRLRLGRALAGITIVVALAAAGAVAAAGNPLESGNAVGQDPTRLGDVGLNNRGELWREAWRIFRADPVIGSGAGTFEIARKRHRSDASSASEPHDVPLQFLAVVAAAAAGAVGALRRLADAERAAAAALAVVPAAYLLHALVDYDWDFPAVTGPTLLAAGALAGAGRGSAPAVRRPFAAAAVVTLALGILLAVATPWLAERSIRQVNRELDRGDLAAAAEAAERARSLNPLSLEAILRQAAVEERRRDADAAREGYAKAVRLQPENPDAWYFLGLYEHDVGSLCQAYVHLNEAYTLDPNSLRWFPGGPLDRARDRVNTPGSC